MTKDLKIVLLGSGNIAFHLAKMLKISNINIHQIYNINSISGTELASKYNTNFTNNINEICSNADIYIIAVKDSFISNIIDKLNIDNGIVVHTSGTTDINIFNNKFINFGILYPLQTFSKDVELNYSDIPFLIEANNDESLGFIENIANKISSNVSVANSEQRKLLHVAAVFACNFTNYLYSVADNLLDKQNLSFNLLKPLIKETTRKALNSKPETNQTGPAKRKDLKIINEHLKVLEPNKELQKLYGLISEMIIENKIDKYTLD